MSSSSGSDKNNTQPSANCPSEGEKIDMSKISSKDVSGSFGKGLEGQTEEQQKEIVRQILANPSKMSEAMSKMNLTNEKMREILSDIKADKDSMQHVNALAEESAIGDQIRATFSQRQSQDHLQSRPSRKKVLKMQKNMKRAMRTNVKESDNIKYSVVHLNRSRKLKSYLVPDDNFVDHIKKILTGGDDSITLTNIEKMIEGEKYTFVCANSGGQNKRMNTILGKNKGSEFVVFMGTNDAIVGDITIRSFESFERRIN